MNKELRNVGLIVSGFLGGIVAAAGITYLVYGPDANLDLKRRMQAVPSAFESEASAQPRSSALPEVTTNDSLDDAVQRAKDALEAAKVSEKPAVTVDRCTYPVGKPPIDGNSKIKDGMRLLFQDYLNSNHSPSSITGHGGITFDSLAESCMYDFSGYLKTLDGEKLDSTRKFAFDSFYSKTLSSKNVCKAYIALSLDEQGLFAKKGFFIMQKGLFPADRKIPHEIKIPMSGVQVDWAKVDEVIESNSYKLDEIPNNGSYKPPETSKPPVPEYKPKQTEPVGC